MRNLGENARAVQWAEAVVFHRIQSSSWLGPVEPTLLALFELALRTKRVVLFDFDDSIFLQYPGIFELMAARSSANLAATHFLMSYAARFNRNTRIVCTAVNTGLWKPSRSRRKHGVTLGWHGSATLQYDYLRLLGPILKRLASRYDLTFRLLGTLGSRTVQGFFASIPGLRCEFGPSSWLPYWKIPALMRGVDIGVSPLIDSRWSRGKCQMKLLEYMALGLPVVASGVGESRYLVKSGTNGFLAQTEDEWVEAISALIEDNGMRARLGQTSRRIAEEEHSIAVTASKVRDAILAGTP
jgi:glycosyltransferase involved in cell wall biosynthesis